MLRPCSLLFAPLLSLVCAEATFAQTFPLSGPAGDTTAVEDTAPFLIPSDFTQTLVVNRDMLEQRGLPDTFGIWDMIAFDATGRYVFIPSEVSSGAGLFRYDRKSGKTVVLMQGNDTGVRNPNPFTWSADNDDFSRLDPATLTPWGSIITGEETTGGRLFEVLNPLDRRNLDLSPPMDPRRRLGDTPGTPEVVWRSSIPAVAHEGLRFDANGALYFIDEDDSGSLYKFVPTTWGDLGQGQTFVLSVDAFAASPTAFAGIDWDVGGNVTSVRTGAATWVPITDETGTPLTLANPYAYVTITGGRNAADEVKGTPFGRPEDLVFGRLANFNEVLYMATTSENRVYSIELRTDTVAFVREFVNFDTINLFTGMDVNPTQDDPFTSPGSDSADNFDDPDNLEIDNEGNVFVLEDEKPGDVWKCFDADRDGVAESMGRWASLGVSGSEPSGLLMDPKDSRRFFLCVQHPSSGNDALWEISIP